MSRRERGGRVLVVLPDSPDESEYAALVESFRAALGAQIIVRQGRTATEYVYELGPTIDCAVSLCDDDDLVESLVNAANGVPVVVYGETRVPGADEVVCSTNGIESFTRRVAAVVEEDRRESELVDANQKLTALSVHASAITGCESVSEVCEETLAAAIEALAFTFCTVALVEGDRIVPRASTLPPEDQNSCHVSEGIAGRTYRTRETQIVGDIAADADALFSASRRSTVSVPLGSYGIIQVVSDSHRAFDEHDAEFLEILAGYTTEALARLDRETALRAERDRLHAFFDNLPVPAVYVEEETPDGRVRCEVNRAYEETFQRRPNPSNPSVEAAFANETERRLFADHLWSGDSVAAEVDRETVAGDRETLELTIVPVPSSGPAGSAYGVYNHDSPRLPAGYELS
ncbi:GAF domain-containing protein [Halogeometricum sp. S1BR25-6]|uniref:GAF domain-containing protein n=1 Tax=Halogeometricum salsisoli TaxID=2950536 RepID=A0ABU2GBF8_9EURY|nr:GAF domain-containing protein [Halogeometricum sp. S1BR25-6]MDS0298142.1 GAF domain-containing protein [Halogeometricum sp. S1BR25-6]